MDPSNDDNNPFHYFPQAALPIPEQDMYNAVHVPPALLPPPPPLNPLHEFAAMHNADYDPAIELFRHQMQIFWRLQMLDMNNVAALKQQLLPLARIKRVMKANPAVKMISADTPLIFSKACEIFIMELTFRAWLHTEEGERRTLERSDLINAMSRADMYSFLLRIP